MSSPLANTLIRPELLAPAGDWECVRAACANGADAIYFGLSDFNARQRAANFTLDELPSLITYLHDRGVRGYVAFNTLIFSDELAQAADFARAIAAAGVDAVIVQDVGLVQLLRRLVPTLAIHASTQMTLTEPRGLRIAQNWGVERVVLARELSVDDIRKVTAGSTMPVEVFVHGALCVAYSGQCLTSEALGGRSANRGQCAQACRLPYTMIVDGTARDLGERAYLLSPQDLAGFDHVAPLLDAGVVSLKIEGRLKTPSYVAQTTQTYRAVLDAALTHTPFALAAAEQRELAQTFSRGLSPGFLDGPNHQMLVQGRFPKSRGVRLGVVERVTRRGIRVRTVAADIVKPGDGVVFDLNQPETTEPGGRVYAVQPVGAGVVELQFGRDNDLSRVPVGCILWKTDDPALRKRLEASYASERPLARLPLTVHATGRVGGPLTLQVHTDEAAATVSWPGPLVAAHTHPFDEASLRTAFARLGETPFTLKAVTVDLPDAVLVPKSVLNDLRRQAVAAVLAARHPSAHPLAAPQALAELRAEAKGESGSTAIEPAGLSVLVRSLDQLDAVLAWHPAAPLTAVRRVYADFEDSRRYREAVQRAHAAQVPIGLAPLRIMKPGEEGFLKALLAAGPDAVLVRNLGCIDYCREHAPTVPLVADFALNVANELTALTLRRLGVTRLVPSFDLNWDQLAALVRRCPPTWWEPVVHQHMPMFHMEHCVFAAFLSTGKDWRDCGRPCDRHQVDLRDRVAANFPVVADAGCRNTVYNAVPQSAAEFLPRMRDLGIQHFRIDLLRETPREVGPLLERYARVLAGLDDGRDTWRHLRGLNQLGVTRGTLQLV